MEKSNRKEKRFIFEVNVPFSVLIRVLFVFLFLITYAKKADAQQDSSFLLHKENITYDEKEGKISLPSFIYADPVMKEIYVLDSRSRIIIYNADFFPIYTIDGRNGLYAPIGMTVDKDGKIYVAQAGSKTDLRKRITVLDACLKFERNIFLSGFEGSASFTPFRLATDKKGYLYVVGMHFPGVLVLDRKYNIVDIMAPEEEGEKVKLNGIAVDKTGRIILLSEDKSRIYIYDENREFLLKFGQKGGSSGKLSRPKGIDVDEATGMIYVADYMRHTITVYDEKGKFIFEFGGLGWSDGWFQHPNHVTVDFMGRILISDFFNNRIQVFVRSSSEIQ
ncbi:MAG: hypothetical protein ABFR82_09960 [Nitrospirota bacterium]